MTERGFDFDKFLICSNPDCFTADTSKAGREKMREVLFGMTGTITDAEIASELENADELKALLDKGYKLDEVERMNKSMIKKVNDSCGKDNSIINSKIDGLLTAKTDDDKAALEKSKTDAEKVIDDATKELARLSTDNPNEAIEAEIKRLEAEISDFKDKAGLEVKEARNKLEIEQRQVNTELTIKKSEYNINAYEVANIEKSIASYNESLENWRKLYKKVQDEVLDSNSCKCPTCGKEYDADRIEEIKKDFEASKTSRMDEYKKRAEKEKANIKDAEELIKTSRDKVETCKAEIASLEKREDEIASELAKLPTEPDLNANVDFKALNSALEAQKAKIVIVDRTSEETALKSRIEGAKAELSEIMKRLGAIEHNAEIDAKVEELREFRATSEQNKAKAEKILDQLDRFRQLKNDKLTAEINSHFSLVEWHLWENQRNGEIKSVCKPYIQGKPMDSCANGSLVTVMKISICVDLQRFYDNRVPIVCDDYSLMSSVSKKMVDTEGSQLIGLVVTEDKDLVIGNA
jgi:chromosome segregation ATPase